MTLSLLPILCLSGCGRKEASLGTESTAITETSDAAAETTENDPSDGEDFVVDLPEDNGGLAGVYKWVEMEKIGITANLIIFDDGIGVFDMLGVVESVKYDDDTMQVSGEGALPQNYTYEDGTLTWVCTDKDGEQVSTFVKLTEEELAEYEARGSGALMTWSSDEIAHCKKIEMFCNVDLSAKIFLKFYDHKS